MPNITKNMNDLLSPTKAWCRSANVLKAEGDSMVYLYDFGDSWRHKVVLEKIIPSDVPTKPVCLDGARRCPPEDVGGPHGTKSFWR